MAFDSDFAYNYRTDVVLFFQITIMSQSQSLFTQTQQQLTTQQLHQRTTVDHPDLPGNIIKHIPRSARLYCAVQLTKAIKIVIAQPDDPAA